jgi:hypothetical protein
LSRAGNCCENEGSLMRIQQAVLMTLLKKG